MAKANNNSPLTHTDIPFSVTEQVQAVPTPSTYPREEETQRQDTDTTHVSMGSYCAFNSTFSQDAQMKRKLDSGGKEEKDSVGNRSLLPCVHFGTVMDHACIFSAEANSLTSLSINLHQKDILLIRPYKSVFGHDDVTSTNLKQGQITEMQRDADHRNAENTK
ncbi:hypothetical protein Anapl_17798 [Anas platyrhynchos]|uniref:Uncharacterized protein n=1 Tax=Anas platyrhynchos TaxID=8839 RepID=R0JHR0_ANAPL|nr:hypothetical protein Anapl_17798 [Anas platyrhynchos]